MLEKDLRVGGLGMGRVEMARGEGRGRGRGGDYLKFVNPDVTHTRDLLLQLDVGISQVCLLNCSW